VPSFTIGLPNLQSTGPVLDIGLAVSGALEDQLRAANDPIPAPIQLQEGLAAKLGLQPVGVTQISTPSSTGVDCYEYAVRFAFPNNVMAEGTAIEAPLKGQHIQGLIGRDVLQHAVFVYIGYSGQFTLSF
jgi:hypothetical protein